MFLGLVIIWFHPYGLIRCSCIHSDLSFGGTGFLWPSDVQDLLIVTAGSSAPDRLVICIQMSPGDLSVMWVPGLEESFVVIA